MKKEQVTGLSKQEGAESPIEPIIQPKLETLQSIKATPDKKPSTVSLPTETK